MCGKKELLWDEDGPSCIAYQYTEKKKGGEMGVTDGDPSTMVCRTYGEEDALGPGVLNAPLAFLKTHVTSEHR